MAKIDLEKLICSLAERNIFLRDALNEQGLEYKDGEIVEVQKQKFHEGEWVVKGNIVAQILDVQEQYYVGLDTEGNDFTSSKFLSDDKMHLWTIEDAKDGDVLRLGCIIAIFKKYIGQEKCICYCSISEDGDFEIPIEEVGDNIYGCTNATPATKSQRDTLFAKMKEAGYKWDAEKKELKKIEEGKASFASRQLYNRAILKILSNYVEKYPDTRFGQMLCNLGILSVAGNNFYRESSKTYQDINTILKKQNGKNRII